LPVNEEHKDHKKNKKNQSSAFYVSKTFDHFNYLLDC